MEKHQAEADYAKWQAKREELNYIKERMEHDYQLDGIYAFHKEITQKSVNRLLHTMSAWHHHKPRGKWVIHLNSVGGYVYPGYALLDELRAYSRRGGGTHHITIKVRGVAASMAAMVLQVADRRVMGPDSLLMIHKGSDEFHRPVPVDELFDWAELNRRQVDAMIRLFLERTDKITRPEFLRRIARKDWWLNASEALDLGLIDEVG